MRKARKAGKQRPSLRPFIRGNRTRKQSGELAEIAFLHKAADLGFGVAKPYGDSERYDFILDSGERLWRVQVKSITVTYSGGGHGYRMVTRHSRGLRKDSPYTAEEIDFLVAYIVPRDVWYVIPVKLVTPVAGICFYPSGCRMGGRFERYREAWHLMAPGGDLKPEPPIPIRVRALGGPPKNFISRQVRAKPKK
jgi:hypothetical protein